MATQTYCDREDIVSIIGEAGLLACIDDNANGQEDPEETPFIASAISRAAAEMNRSISKQYSPLTGLASNEWCKWCNAYLAIFHLQARRSNAPAASVIEAVISNRELLEHIRWGRESVPEGIPTHNHSPAVSNFSVQPNNPDGPIVVNVEQSTGGNPSAGVRRNVGGLINHF